MRFAARPLFYRALIPGCLFLGALAIPVAMSQNRGAGALIQVDPALGMETLPLWPQAAPGAKGEAAADTPTLTVFRPVHPNGTAVIVVPGGAYIGLASDHEGRQPADRLAETGVTTFVLKYRLGPTYLYPVPLGDARRAVRLVRSLAPKYGYSPERIGMMGFSAGGHLAAMTGTTPEEGKPQDADSVEHESTKVDFMVLVYPWLNAMQPQVPNPAAQGKLMINYCSVTKGLTQADCQKLEKEYTPLLHVGASTPPTWIVHTADDNTVPVMTSVEFFTAMHKAGADCELHVMAHGPHGFGTGGDLPALAGWQDAMLRWMRARGLLAKPGEAH